jgi:RimJ/RimL family protein N-acetyltransferase
MAEQGRQHAPPELTDGSLILRAWREEDAPAVLAACQDPEIQHWLPVPVPYLDEHARGFVIDFARDEWSSGRGAPFAVVDADNQALVASAGLKDIDLDAKVATGGYWVAPWARGQRVALRAMQLVCDWAYSELGLDCVEFFVEPTNRGSCLTVENLGAVWQEIIPDMEVVQGTSRDTARYALSRASFEGRHPV